MKRSFLHAAAAYALIGALCVSGFSAAAVMAEETESTAEVKVIGEKKDGDYEVTLKNSTGKEVKSICIEMDKEGFGENLLKEDDAFADGEERVLYVTPKEMKDQKPPVYDIELTFQDDTKSVLHTFPFGDADEAEILLSDGVAYIKFMSLSLKKEHNTLEHEKTLVPAKADAPAESAPAANQAPAASGTESYSYEPDNSGYDYSYDDGSYYDNSYDYDYDYGYDDSSYADYDYDYSGDSAGGSDTAGTDSGAAPADGCIDDGVILN